MDTSAPRRPGCAATAIVALLLAPVLNLLFFSAIVWMAKPFWTPVDRELNKALGFNWPWAGTVCAIGLALALFFGLAVRRALRRRREGRFPVLAALSLPLAIGAACIANFVLAELFRQLEKDTMMLPLRAIDWAPYAAAIMAVALLTVVFPRLSFWRSARIRLELLALLLLSFAIFFYRPWPPKIVAGPWLELMDDAVVRVSWITDKPTTGRVEYGDGLYMLDHKYGFSNVSRIHHVMLDGVAPGVPIAYRVSSSEVRAVEPYSMRLGRNVESPWCIFTAPDPNAASVRFLFISDLHEQTQLLPDLLKAADYRNAAFVVLNGDTLFQAQNEYQVIRLMKNLTAQFASQVPFVFIRGNHDSAGPFARSLPDYVGFGDFGVQCMRVGPAAIMCLDTGDFESDPKGCEELQAYQQAVCAETAVSEWWTEAPFRIVCGHVGMGAEGGFFNGPDMVRPDLEMTGHVHTTSANYLSAHPNLTASGDSWFQPESFPVFSVLVNEAGINVRKLLRTGEDAEHWNFGNQPIEPPAPVPVPAHSIRSFHAGLFFWRLQDPPQGLEDFVESFGNLS